MFRLQKGAFWKSVGVLKWIATQNDMEDSNTTLITTKIYSSNYTSQKYKERHIVRKQHYLMISYTIQVPHYSSISNWKTSPLRSMIPCFHLAIDWTTALQWTPATRVVLCESLDFYVQGFLPKVTKCSQKLETKTISLLITSVISNFRGKKYIIILDDVWTEQHSSWMLLTPLTNIKV